MTTPAPSSPTWQADLELCESMLWAGGLNRDYDEWEDAARTRWPLALRRVLELEDENTRLRSQIRPLEDRIGEQRRQLQRLNEASREKSVALDAMHWVWCSGGCETGTHQHTGSPDDVTAEVVEAAIRNTERLVAWHGNRQWKLAYRNASADVRQAWLEECQRRYEAEGRVRELEQECARLREEVGRAREGRGGKNNLDGDD